MFITLEGLDGAGKGTHIEFIADEVRKLSGKDVVLTREPGGTELGERLREILLSQKMDPTTEAMLMFAARNEHVERVIQPSLNDGKVVICDRYSDSSFAYQGARGASVAHMNALEQIVGLRPDKTLFFALPLKVARQRMQGRDLDKFEEMGDSFFAAVEQLYIARVGDDPERFVVMDASQPIDAVRRMLRFKLEQIFTRG